MQLLNNEICTLTPSFVEIYLKMTKLCCVSIKTTPIFYCNFYVNPVALVATSPKVLQRLRDEVDRSSNIDWYSIRYPFEKGKGYGCSRKKTLNVTCHLAVLEQVDKKFKYLGTIIDELTTYSTESHSDFLNRLMLTMRFLIAVGTS